MRDDVGFCIGGMVEQRDGVARRRGRGRMVPTRSGRHHHEGNRRHSAAEERGEGGKKKRKENFFLAAAPVPLSAVRGGKKKKMSLHFPASSMLIYSG